MQTAKVESVTARIAEQVERDPGGALAFDGDGTLWSGDIGEDFFAAVLQSGRLTDQARAALAREADEHGLGAQGSAAELAHRIHAAYLGGAFPEERVCEIMTWVVAGWTRDALDAFSADVMARLHLGSRLHAEAIHVVEWAKRQGIAVHLVSASPRAIVEQAARVVGIELGRVSAAREAVTDGLQVAAAVERPIPYGPGKVQRLGEQIGDRPLYAAFGDNAFDAALLRASRVPVAIRPKPRLLERASEVPGLVVLERL